MGIDLYKSNFVFSSKPLLIVGKLMEYSDLRKVKDDINFIVIKVDYKRLIKQYPKCQKDFWGELGHMPSFSYTECTDDGNRNGDGNLPS